MPVLLPALALTIVPLLFQAPPVQPQPDKRAPATSEKKSVNPSDEDAAVIKEFLKRVDGYVALHKKMEDTLPPLPAQTNPTVVDQHERALAKLIQAERKAAKQGDLFTIPMQRLVRRLMRP